MLKFWLKSYKNNGHVAQKTTHVYDNISSCGAFITESNCVPRMMQSEAEEKLKIQM